ncbi:MAG: hypothetical protein C0467_08500 [Planctomycetaceae bacterium]|nr:hypothetical protein [Planctomycetaceae bacterium]
MRNLLALVGLLVVGFACVGWYCGWYKLSVGKGQNGNLQIETEVQTKKVVEDSSSFFQKLGKMAGEQIDKNGQPVGNPVGTPGPSTTPTGKDAFQGGWLISPEKRSQPTTSNR